MTLTPMMQQYMEIKEQHKDAILFFRLGDFYEMFFDDALVASKAMEVTLTGKNCGLPERAPMCGVPYHAADGYIAKLIEKGFKVAVCEQTEDPAEAKGLVRREVVRVVTPGTVTSQTMLRANENNYLAAIYTDREGAGLVYCDVSTGEISAAQRTGPTSGAWLKDELARIDAREVLYNREEIPEDDVLSQLRDAGVFLTPLPPAGFDRRSAETRLRAQFGATSLAGLGLEGKEHCLLAVGAILSYLADTQRQTLSHIQSLRVTEGGDHMTLDRATLRNLELTETLYEKSIQGSLLGILDLTVTAMGARRLKQWIREPLNRLPAIRERLDAVELLTDSILLRNDLRAALRHIYDLERLSGRIAAGTANARDLVALRDSLFHLPGIREEVAGEKDPLLTRLSAAIDPLNDVYDAITSAIVEEPPFAIREGGLIRSGYSQALDDLKESIRDGRQWIAALEGEERKRTGIKNLKVGFNKVFGYYIEVTKSNYDSVPADYIRKQTLVSGERFITPELKEVESLVLNAETKINQLEYELFQELRESIQARIGRIQETAQALSVLDVLLSFAEAAQRYRYCRPVVDESDRILIEKGRHPVLEQSGREPVFVPNDVYLDRDQACVLLITGPNMAGKSTYMRQTALLVLMAQIGSFVPADEARIGLVDRIYTRIGASDNLSQGQSTFYVEMSELANILNTATGRSLVLLDEIGRGTSTYDGLSIAWAAVDSLCRPERRVRTLFATHYHELTVLEEQMPGVLNLNVDVQETGGTIVFLHKIIPGSTSRSYGIHVAKLAGVPGQVLRLAERKLRELEEAGKEQPTASLEEQLSVFSAVREEDTIRRRLREIDLMEITPARAIALLEELKHEAEH